MKRYTQSKEQVLREWMHSRRRLRMSRIGKPGDIPDNSSTWHEGPFCSVSDLIAVADRIVELEKEWKPVSQHS